MIMVEFGILTLSWRIVVSLFMNELECNFSYIVLVWLWCHGNVNFVKQVWKYSLFFNVSEELGQLLLILLKIFARIYHQSHQVPDFSLLGIL